MMRFTASIIILTLVVFTVCGCMAATQTGNFSVEQYASDVVRVDEATPEAINVVSATPDVSPQSTESNLPDTTENATVHASETPIIASAMPTVELTPIATTEAIIEPTVEPSMEPTSTPETTKSPEPTKTPTPTPKYEVTDLEKKAAYLNAGSANFRKGPGLDYKIIAELKEGTAFTVVGKSGDWYKVKYDGEYGFIKAEFVEYGTPPTPKAEKTPSPTPTATPSPSPTATVKPTESQNTSASNGNSVSGNTYFSSGGGFTADELLLIAQVVQEEAKGTDVESRAAVANVIYNRIKSSKFPNTVEGVIFQTNQFSVANNKSELQSVVPIDKTIQAVKNVFVDGNRFLPSDVLYFRSASKGTSWSKRTYYATYGGNSFFY